MEQATEADRSPRYGDAGWKPSRFQRDRARAVPPPYEEDVLPRVTGHAGTPDRSARSGVVRGFSHLVIEVTDLDRSEAWYRDIVGMDLMGRNLTAEDRPHSLLQTNTGQFWILVQAEKITPPRTSGMHHAFMMTPNQYRRMMERVLAAGYDLVDIRAQFRARGQYSINIKDPDGHAIQFQCDSPEAHEIIRPGVGIVDCGPAEGYKLGDVKLFKDGDFFLVRLREGFLAMSRWCTHLNGRIIYQKAHWRFYCPYHQSTFDRRGNPTGGEPNLNALRLNAVSVSSEGHVLVNTDEISDRACYDPEQAVQPPERLAAVAG